jgi:hypothetical protein
MTYVTAKLAGAGGEIDSSAQNGTFAYGGTSYVAFAPSRRKQRGTCGPRAPHRS